MRRMWLLVVTLVIPSACQPSQEASDPAADEAQDARMVDVDGHQMHVLTIGLENAESGSPVVVF